MFQIPVRAAAAIAATLVIAGCAVSQSDVNSAYDAASRTMTGATGDGPQSMPLVEDVPTAFLGDRLVPVAYEASLPAVFRDKVVTFPANLTIRKIATLVSSATGYPVHLSPDVFVPRDSLIPREGSGDAKATTVAYQGQGGRTSEEPLYAQPFNGRVGQYLRGVSEDLGLDWSFDGSSINISRFVTRMYQVAAIPGKVSIKSDMSNRAHDRWLTDTRYDSWYGYLFTSSRPARFPLFFSVLQTMAITQ
ncbi:hypothetical protein bAD24_p01010 (plasmid) [Burkholderia sp. AD24]|nr:hypothetical protein bAD24_p01010 [Burkholderia sp. AD24]